MVSQLTTVVTGILLVLGVAAGVRIVAARLEFVIYPVLLVVVGIAVSVLGIDPGFRLSAELITVVLLPTILFHGARETRTEHFWSGLPVVAALTAVGLPVAVLLLGWLACRTLGLPLGIGLLFATMVSPIDPVAIIAVFREAGAPDRLAAIAETESHLGDGVAIVLFGAVLDLLARRLETTSELTGVVGAADLVAIGGDVLWVSAVGLAVGVAAGGFAAVAIRAVEDRMAEFLVLVVLPYAAFLVADHWLHASGVLATVAAGLVMGAYGEGWAIHPDNVAFVEHTWETAAFLVYTLLFVMIGLQVPFRRVLFDAGPVLLATGLVLVVRAVVVYGTLSGVNRVVANPVPRRWQHVLVWGGMHTVIPVALLLLLPVEFPYRDRFGPLVFGVAILSIVVQGQLLPYTLRATGTTVGREE